MNINTIYNESNITTLERMPDDFIDLTVTSPPYDNLRDYKGYTFDFENLAKLLYQKTKQGGVVVWVVGDAVVKGSETGTSFKQALFFMQCGFRLHDTMIYNRFGRFPDSTRYRGDFEYMFILSKGKPKTFNGIKDRKNKKVGISTFSSERDRNGGMVYPKSERRIKAYGCRGNIWQFNTGLNCSTKDSIAFKHPAIFPEKLANDHIISWSNKDNIIYDPFMGSGTTAKMAILNNRNYIGSEISAEYCEISQIRINDAIATQNSKLFNE